MSTMMRSGWIPSPKTTERESLQGDDEGSEKRSPARRAEGG